MLHIRGEYNINISLREACVNMYMTPHITHLITRLGLNVDLALSHLLLSDQNDRAFNICRNKLCTIVNIDYIVW